MRRSLPHAGRRTVGPSIIFDIWVGRSRPTPVAEALAWRHPGNGMAAAPPQRLAAVG